MAADPLTHPPTGGARGLAALFAGPGAYRVLRPGACGQVIVASRAAAYARLGGDHVLLCGVRAPFGPLSVAVSRPEQLDLRPGVAVAARPGALLVGELAISLERLRVRGRAAPPRAGTTVDAALVAAVAARLQPLPASLATGLRALEAGKVGEAVAALAGRGAGLTPDGDDVLAGYAAWRHAVGNPAPLAEAAVGLASPIGLSYLRCAQVGELPAAAAGLLAAILAGDRAAALGTLPALRRWGSSSGTAVAHGIAAGACESACAAPAPSVRAL